MIEFWDDKLVPLDFLHWDRHSFKALSTSRLAALTYKQRRLGIRSRDTELLNVLFVGDGEHLRIARVEPRAHIRAQPNVDNEPRWITLEREMEFEVCEVNDSECPFSCVLVPGYGFGWVIKNYVASVQAESVELLLSSPLTGFRIRNSSTSEQFVSSVLWLIDAVSDNLRTLRWIGYGGLSNTRGYGRLCPLLHSTAAHRDPCVCGFECGSTCSAEAAVASTAE